MIASIRQGSIIFAVSMVLFSAMILSTDGLSFPTSKYERGPRAIHRMAASDKPPIIVDLRSSGDFGSGHLAGALNLSPTDWELFLSGLISAGYPRRSLVVYCGSATCGVSRNVAERVALEFPAAEVFWLSGGWEAWTSLGLPVSL